MKKKDVNRQTDRQTDRHTHTHTYIYNKFIFEGNTKIITSLV